MKLFLFLMASMASWAGLASAKGAKTSTSPEPQSTFYVDKSAMDEIYKSGLHTQREAAPANGDSRIEPRLGILLPSELRIENDYFVVDHAANVDSVPYVSFSAAKLLTSTERTDTYLEGGIGFATQQTNYTVESTTGIEVEDTVTLQWLPVSFGGRLEYRIAGVSSVKPGVAAGCSANWIQQQGTLEGLDQSFWVPTVYLAPALTLFSSEYGNEGAFGGLTVGVAYHRGVSATAGVAGWTVNVGSQLLL